MGVHSIWNDHICRNYPQSQPITHRSPLTLPRNHPQRPPHHPGHCWHHNPKASKCPEPCPRISPRPNGPPRMKQAGGKHGTPHVHVAKTANNVSCEPCKLFVCCKPQPQFVPSASATRHQSGTGLALSMPRGRETPVRAPAPVTRGRDLRVSPVRTQCTKCQ